MVRRVALMLLAFVSACAGSAQPSPALPMPEVVPDAAAPSPSAAAGPDASASPSPYSGHGVASIPPELLEKYRPRPLPPDTARHIQSLLDVRAPGVGLLSPDGKSMYFAWTITGVPQIWRIDGPRHFPEELTGGEDPTTLSSMTPDGAWLVLQRDRKGEENPGLYLQSPSGGPLLEIQHQKGIQTHYETTSADGHFVYFTANDVKPGAYVVYRYDVAKKVKEVAFDREEGLWHVSDLKDDGRLLLRKETGGLWAEYSEWDPAKKTLTPLFGQNEKEEYDARYGAKEGEIIVLTNRPSEYRRLYTWEKGKLTPRGDAIKFDVDQFDVDKRRSRILYTTNEAGYTRLHALEARTHKSIALPAFPAADHVRYGQTTPDARFTTIGIDDGRHPMQGYVLDWRRGTLDKWHAPSTPEIDTTKFARASLEAYPAGDGTNIPVFVRRPERCASDPCPVVIAFHGGPEDQARPGFSVGAQMFVDAGFVFAEPNVRGSDGYGKTWLRADDGPKRLDIITDIEDAAKWARVKFAANGKTPKVGIYGGSYGGYSVLMGMTRFAGAYDAASISWASVICAPSSGTRPRTAESSASPSTATRTKTRTLLPGSPP